MPKHDIEDLSLWQFRHLAFHPRNDKGELVIDKVLEGREDMEDMFKRERRFIGLRERDIAQEWDDHIRINDDELTEKLLALAARSNGNNPIDPECYRELLSGHRVGQSPG